MTRQKNVSHMIFKSKTETSFEDTFLGHDLVIHADIIAAVYLGPTSDPGRNMPTPVILRPSNNSV